MPPSKRSIIPIIPSTSTAQRHFQDELVACAHRQLLFLTIVYSEGVSIQRPKVASLRRYVDLWLPLVAKQRHSSKGDDVELIPPADIAWLWHVHRLAPRLYVHHVRSTGLVNENDYLDANPPFALQLAGPSSHDDIDSKLDYDIGSTDGNLFDNDIEAPPVSLTNLVEETTRNIWEKEYLDEPFFLEDCDNENTCKSSLADELDGDDDTLVSGYDLLAAAERQSTFFWQVSRSCFRQDKFLREGVDRYHKFLLLWKSAKNVHLLIPTFQIDLIWHSHMLSSTKKYDEDCRALIGCGFDHDDSLDDRSEGSTEFIAFNATKSLWERTYGTNYNVEGAMYRGQPPASFFSGDFKYLTTRSSAGPLEHFAPKDDIHSNIPPVSPQARFAHTLGLHRLPQQSRQQYPPPLGPLTTRSSAAGPSSYQYNPGPPQPTSVPSSSRSEVTHRANISTYQTIQCKLFFFGIALIGVSFLPLFYPANDCTDCVPCPDNEENATRPEDFRLTFAIICFFPGTALLFFTVFWTCGVIKPPGWCLDCLDKNCKGGGVGGGGGCGGGGCGGC